MLERPRCQSNRQLLAQETAASDAEQISCESFRLRLISVESTPHAIDAVKQFTEATGNNPTSATRSPRETFAEHGCAAERLAIHEPERPLIPSG
jgi:hypothetical protein